MTAGTTITVGSKFPWGIVLGVTLVAGAAAGGAYLYYRHRRKRGTSGCPCQGGRR